MLANRCGYLKQNVMEELIEQSVGKEYGVTTRKVGMYHNYSFLLPTLELLVEQRKKLKISLNKMSKDLYGSRYYVNYLSKIEKGEIPNVSYEVIARMHTYLGEIDYQLNKK
jgi:type III secretion system FlhB-like substrate exporter